ncbi:MULTISPECIES: hypothetical protein [Streptomyces rochei group]|uniref:hypothetical protein n=1 Tax=Streptomyces rochei group TaxID=2867164 RepID=UPI0018756673|nr:hypothetical protein [Streptomyces vinaceusdrappus]GHB98701.1 hypothetical protein GCM10010308_07690 [Streptomyces vinaceusdrappus]
MNVAAITPEARGTTLLTLSGMYSLMTDAQRAGRACPWCNTPVTTETGIDLGERRLDRAGDVIHPVACRRCTNWNACQEYAQHCRTCTVCLYAEPCTPKMLLRRLALETRR